MRNSKIEDVSKCCNVVYLRREKYGERKFAKGKLKGNILKGDLEKGQIFACTQQK